MKTPVPFAQNLLKLSVVLCLFAFTFNSAFAQSDLEKRREIYQNQQRALNLSLLKNEIKSVEDAPIRCFLRTQIINFIFEKKVNDYFDTANTFALDCLEDIEKNKEQFPSSLSHRYSNNLLSLLRINSPEIAAKAEKKYFVDKNTDWSDFLEIGSTKDSTAAINRVLEKIAKGDFSLEIYPIYDKLREKNPAASIQILSAILNRYETAINFEHTNNTLFSLASLYLEKSTPLEIKKRFLNLAVKIGQKAILESNNSILFHFSKDNLKRALPEIEKTIPSLYQQASAIYSTLDSRVSRYEKLTEEVYRRINESDDKLQQTIAEAENPDNKHLKNELWTKAAELALQEKKFQLAVDLIFKNDSSSEISQSIKNQFLVEDVLSAALKERDFESAEYIIKNIEDLNERARGILEIASSFVELGNNSQAFEKVEEALKVLEKAENTSAKVRIMLSAVPIALKIDKNRAFGIASSAIKVINRLPTPNPEDKTGTDSRKQYVEKVLSPNAFNVVSAFRLLAKEDVEFAYPTSQEIQQRDLRLAAQIIAETEKKYPLPETTKKTN